MAVPENRLSLLIALAAVSAPVYRILVNARIPLLLPETLLVLAMIMVIAVVLGLVLRLSGRRLRLVLLAAILFIHLDLAGVYVGLFETIGLLGRTRVWAKGGVFLLLFGVICMGLWAMRRYAVQVAAVYFVAVGLVTVITEPLPRLASETTAATSLPAVGDTGSEPTPPLVIHLLFDALLAPGAIERGIAGGDAVYEAMQRLAGHYGFRVFERAFSRHSLTATAMPNLMNAEYEEQDAKPSFEPRSRVEANAYFDDYAARGYGIRVYQTSHLDFCAHEKVSVCVEFDSFNPAWLIAHESDTGAFSAITARTFGLLRILLHGHGKNYTGRLLARLVLGVQAPLVGVSSADTIPALQPLRHSPRFDVPGFSAWFDDFADDLMRSDRGTLWFAHFLVPHFPYLLTPACELSGARQATVRPPPVDPDEKRKQALGHYYAQVQCVFLKLEGLLERISHSERHRDALIIVHGDHGPSFSPIYNPEKSGKRDFIDTYATFFAVRAPGRVLAGHDCEAVPLPDLFVRYAKHTHGENPDTVAAPEHTTVFVPVGSFQGPRIERAMPEFACFHDNPN